MPTAGLQSFPAFIFKMLQPAVFFGRRKIEKSRFRLMVFGRGENFLPPSTDVKNEEEYHVKTPVCIFFTVLRDGACRRTRIDGSADAGAGNHQNAALRSGRRSGLHGVQDLPTQICSGQRHIPIRAGDDNALQHEFFRWQHHLRSEQRPNADRHLPRQDDALRRRFHPQGRPRHPYRRQDPRRRDPRHGYNPRRLPPQIPFGSGGAERAGQFGDRRGPLRFGLRLGCQQQPDLLEGQQLEHRVCLPVSRLSGPSARRR